jgi:hypothetical protein
VAEYQRKPKSRFKDVAELFIKKFLATEDHHSFKSIEVQLDFLEFLLGTIPEALINDIGDVCLILIQCKLLRTRQEISDKAVEILNFIKAVLMPDLVLPDFIAALELLMAQS